MENAIGSFIGGIGLILLTNKQCSQEVNTDKGSVVVESKEFLKSKSTVDALCDIASLTLHNDCIKDLAVTYERENPRLSSGALTWSGNSKPIPEISAGIPDYVRVPLLGSWFSVKGHIGYGRLTDDTWRKDNGGGTYAEGVLFHSKSLFVRFGDYDRFPLQVTLGLEMRYCGYCGQL